MAKQAKRAVAPVAGEYAVWTWALGHARPARVITAGTGDAATAEVETMDGARHHVKAREVMTLAAARRWYPMTAHEAARWAQEAGHGPAPRPVTISIY